MIKKQECFFSFFLFLFLVLPLHSALAAQCNEACLTTSDCSDSSCAVCIGSCVTCYAIGESTTCLSTENGGSTNCKWDGRNCKALTDTPEMPSPFRYLFLLLIPLFAFGFRHFKKIKATKG
jgi:hypothetical protein